MSSARVSASFTRRRSQEEVQSSRSLRGQACSTHGRYQSRRHRLSCPDRPQDLRLSPACLCQDRSSVRYKGCPSPDSNAASSLLLPETAAEKLVTDRLSIVQYN